LLDRKSLLNKLISKNLEDAENIFFCEVLRGYSPDKNKESKYYVRESEYNSELYGINHYSDYCFGPGFVMS